MSMPTRAIFAPLITTACVAALVLGAGAASASAVAATVLTASINHNVITAPLSDGFNDTSTLTITSNDPATVSVDVFTAAGHQFLVGENNIVLADQGINSYGTTYDIGGLVAGEGVGDYTIEVEQGATNVETHDLAYGSGQVDSGTIVVTPNATSLATNATPADTLSATVSAADETGTALPLTGESTLKDSDLSHVADAELAPNGATVAGATVTPIDVTGFTTGQATLDVNVLGPADTDSRSAGTVDIQLSAPQHLTGVLVDATSSVNPVKDGYRDTLPITITPQKASADDLAYAGSVVITKGTKTVATLPFSGSGASSTVTWSGLVSGKIVTGTYDITTTLNATVDGSAVSFTDATNVIVSAKKLVAKTAVVTFTGKAFFAANGNNDNNVAREARASGLRVPSAATTATTGCKYIGTTLDCYSGGGEDNTGAFGFQAIPASITRFADVKSFRAKMTFDVSYLRGKTSNIRYQWGTNDEQASDGPTAIGAAGKLVTKSHSFGGDAESIVGIVLVNGSAAVHVSKVTVNYTYYALG